MDTIQAPTISVWRALIVWKCSGRCIAKLRDGKMRKIANDKIGKSMTKLYDSHEAVQKWKKSQWLRPTHTPKKKKRPP